MVRNYLPCSAAVASGSITAARSTRTPRWAGACLMLRPKRWSSSARRTGRARVPLHVPVLPLCTCSPLSSTWTLPSSNSIMMAVAAAVRGGFRTHGAAGARGARRVAALLFRILRDPAPGDSEWITTIPASVTKCPPARSASRSHPISVFAGSSTFASMIARRILQ